MKSCDIRQICPSTRYSDVTRYAGVVSNGSSALFRRYRGLALDISDLLSTSLVGWASTQVAPVVARSAAVLWPALELLRLAPLETPWIENGRIWLLHCG